MSVLIFDPYTSIIAAKVHYKALETLIENEEKKREKIAVANGEINKFMM